MPGLVDAAAGEGGGDEPATHLGFGGVGAGQRLRVGEVGGRRADVFADQFDRAVEFGADLGGVGPVEQGVGVGVRADRDEPGGGGVARARPSWRVARPTGTASPLSMKWVAAYRVAGMPYSTSAGTTSRRSRRCRRRR